MSFLAELKRRNVFRMAALYAVASWLVLQVADVLVGVLGVPDWTMRFVLMLLLLGLPFALIFSWVYELTPEGLKRERDVVREDSVTADTARKLNVVLISLLAAVLVVFAVDRFLPESDQQQAAVDVRADASVAVLPFADRSPEGGQQYLADGMTEILLHRLAQVPELKVAARTSSFVYRDRQVDVREVGDLLGVAHVLEGSVQRVGDQLRITAQLVRTEDGFQVWSRVFDKRYSDLFAIQDEISDTVSSSLVASLFGEAAGLPVNRGRNIEAYDLYLQALADFRTGSVVNLRKAVDLLERAVAIEPDFSEAIALQAQTYMAQINTGDRAAAEGLTLARETAERALTLNSDLVDAAVVQVEATGRAAAMRGDLPQLLVSAEDMEQLVERFPGEVAPKTGLAGYYNFAGRGEDALRMLDLALELDPLNAQLHARRGSLLGTAFRRYAEARDELREAIRIEPGNPNFYSVLALFDQQIGDFSGFILNTEQAAALDPADVELPGSIANLLYTIGLPDHARPYHEAARAMTPDAGIILLLDLAAVRSMGDADQLLEAAKSMIDIDAATRTGVRQTAIVDFYRVHHARGTLAEANAYMSAREPSWMNPDPAKMRGASFWVRLVVSPLMFEDASQEVRRAEAAFVRSNFEELGGSIEDTNFPNLLALGLDGDDQAVIDYLVDDLFVKFPYQMPTSATRWYLDLPMFRNVAQDPEVAAGIEAWDRTLARSTEQVKRFLDERAAAKVGAASTAD
ncbi:MAG: hypothetical protein AAF545_04760 [Pseudomonadota bacterium]